VGFQVPEVADKDGKIEWSHREGSSEELTLTPKKLEEIQANLRDLDPQKWQLLTKLPERLFRFNLLMFSDTTSPNNAKKESYFLVTVPINSAQKKVMPGEKFLLGKSLEIQEIAKVVADIKINLVYGMGMYMTFFSKNGELISQATGRMVIEPTFGVQASVFLGVWVMLVALVALLKKTLLIPREVGEVTRHYKRRNRYPG
jgi:hypothetical protein